MKKSGYWSSRSLLNGMIKLILYSNKTEHAVQSYTADKTTLEVKLRMKILNGKSFIAEY